MKMEFAFEREAERAKKEHWPLIIPVGTMEYHGPHCAFGCDTLIVTGLLERLEKMRDIVVYPPVWYGVASYAVAGPEMNSVHVDVDTFEANMYSILKSLILGGWKNIYMIIQHQFENEELNPMTLACMKAGKKLVFEYLEATQGNAWWGSNKNKDFYETLAEGDANNPWNWIKTIPAISKRAQKATGYDHAGKYECSILSALYPETVDISRLNESDAWFIQSAAESSKELGEIMVQESLKDLNERIK